MGLTAAFIGMSLRFGFFYLAVNFQVLVAVFYLSAQPVEMAD